MFDDDVTKASLSGGLTGAALGGFSSVIESGNPKLALRRALLGGLLGSGLAGGSIAAGKEITGIDDTDPSTYTDAGAAGGGVLGAGAGALAGGILGSGALRLPTKNSLIKYLTKAGIKKGASLGGLAGGTIGAYTGAGEGMQLDFLQNTLAEKQKDRLLRKIMEENNATAMAERMGRT